MTTSVIRTEEPGGVEQYRMPWSLVVLLILAMVVCYAHRGALSIAAPFMMKDLGLPASTMGILLSAFFWLYAFMQVPAGWVVDRFGVKWAYAVGFAFWSVASALTGFAQGAMSLIGVRLALGVGQSVAFPASASAVSRRFRDRERGLVTAGYLSGVRVGQAIVGAIGALMIAKFGYRGFFLIIGVTPLFWLIPWFAFWSGRQQAADTTGGSAAAARASFSFGDAIVLLKHRTVLGIFLGYFAYDYVWFVYVTWLPSYLVIGRHFTTAEMGFYSSVPYLIMMVVILISGALSDYIIRRGRSERAVRKWFVAVGMLIACLIVPAGFVEDKVTSVWLLTAALMGIGIASPNTWTLTQVVCARPIVGTVSGIQNFGGNLGGIVAPALTGSAVHLTGSFVIPFVVCGVVLVVGVLCYWLMVSDRVEIQPEAAPIAR
jgi:MFS transporter, ACS family, D-galactonate transporter